MNKETVIPGFIQLSMVSTPENTVVLILPISNISRFVSSEDQKGIGQTDVETIDGGEFTVLETAEEIAAKLQAAQRPASILTPELLEGLTALAALFKLTK